MARPSFFPVMVAIFSACALGARKRAEKQGQTVAPALAEHDLSVRVGQGAEQDVFVTTNGCTCSSSCEAKVTTGWSCDQCQTKGSCGSFSLSGRWGWCDYRPSTVPTFTGRSSSSKLEYYWSKIVANRTRYPDFPFLSNIATSVRTSFDNFRPEMPRGREKLIHTVGSVCKVRMEINDSPYTGVLGNGVQEGFIRMGGALDPSFLGPGITPGLGFKFPRSGVHDGDFVMLYSLNSGDQWNFFAKNQSNHLATIGGVASILVAKFRQASQCPYQVGLSDLAKYSQDGTEHKTPKFPFKLFMVPNPAIKTGQGEETIDAVHAELDALPIGTTLYTTYACQEPLGKESQPSEDLSGCGKPLVLGDVVTTSECTTSQYGDASFHIRHQRIEEDWQLEPSYFQQGDYDARQACDDGSLTPYAAPPTCGLEGMLNTDGGTQAQ